MFQFRWYIFMIKNQNLLVVVNNDGNGLLCESSITSMSCFNNKLEQIDDLKFTSHISSISVSIAHILIWFTEKSNVSKYIMVYIKLNETLWANIKL